MSSINPLVPTTDNKVKEGINYMQTKPNVEEKSISHRKGENKIHAINETDKPHASQSKKDKSISNESNKGMSLDKSGSLDKSRASQITEIGDTVNTLNKSRSISSVSLSDKIINIEKPKERKVIS